MLSDRCLALFGNVPNFLGICLDGQLYVRVQRESLLFLLPGYFVAVPRVLFHDLCRYVVRGYV